MVCVLEDSGPGDANEYVGRVTSSPAKRISPILDAIRQALTVAVRLPESEGARRLRDQCLAYQNIVEQWSREPPTAEEREALMKQVLTLHLTITRLHRSGA
jgi:hypothetical protein